MTWSHPQWLDLIHFMIHKQACYSKFLIDNCLGGFGDKIIKSEFYVGSNYENIEDLLGQRQLHGQEISWEENTLHSYLGKFNKYVEKKESAGKL